MIRGILPALALLAGCATSSNMPTPPEDISFEAAGEHWLRQGVQVGEKLDNENIYTIDGESMQLQSLWHEKPALIVTVSLTCPVARESCPQLGPIVDEYGEHVNIALLYTIDAHPKGDMCPYKPGEEWVTKANETEGILHRQPVSLEERLALAREMHARLGIDAPMYVDEMDNEVWLMLGGGPNLAVLVDTDGIVRAKQGWLDVESLAPSVEIMARR